MADPLGATASVLAIVSACTVCATKLYKIIRTLHDAPQEVLALSNEVNDIKAIVEAYKEAVETHSRIVDEECENILLRAGETLTKLRLLMTGLVVDAAEETYQVKRSRWLRKKSKLLKLCEELKAVRLSLHLLMDAGSTSSVFRIERAVLDLGSATAQAQNQNVAYFGQFATATASSHIALHESLATQSLSQAQQTKMLETILHRTSASSSGDKSTLLPALDHPSATAGQCSLTLQAQQPSQIAATSTYQATSLSTLSIQLRRQSHCGKGCNCICHSNARWRSPSLLDAYFGTLIVGYLGLPKFTPKCNRDECRGNAATYIEMTYCFPQWFLERAVYMLAAMNGFGGPVVGLTVRRRTEYTCANSIFQMAVVGNVEGVRALLTDKTANPNDVNTDYGETALWWAVKGGHPGVCKLLLDAGADPNIQNDRSMTITEQTAARILCEPPGSSFAKEFGALFPMDDFSETFEFSQVHKVVLGLLPLHLETMFANAMYRTDIDTGDVEGKTPLYWAARRGDVYAVEQLLLAGANVNAQDHGKDTPLGAAGRAASVRCIELLLVAGAKVDAKDCFGYTSLANICKWQTDPALARPLILAGADPNSLDKKGATVFARSARYNTSKIGSFLLDRGADIDRRDGEGNPPLFEAIMKGCHEFLELLLSRGASTTIKNNAGWGILHVLSIHGSLRSIELVTTAGLSGIDPGARDVKGKTALQHFEARVAPPPGFGDALMDFLESINVLPEHVDIGSVGVDTCVEVLETFHDALEMQPCCA